MYISYSLSVIID